MSNIINENNKMLNISSNANKNINRITFPLNEKEPEEKKKDEDPKIILNKKLVNNFNENNSLQTNNELTLNSGQKNINNISDNSNIFEKKNKIFKVVYRNIHDGDSLDNIKQSIINHFINFFIMFINFIISEKLKEKELKFQIDCNLKTKIKFEDILGLTVEQLLTIESTKNIKTNKNENNKNYNIINKIRKTIGSSLNNLFETPVIDLFRDIYAKDYSNNIYETQIELKEYGIEGIKFKINEDIPTYEKLKEKFKNNLKKIKLMNDLVQNKLINPQKPKMFKIKKKKDH